MLIIGIGTKIEESAGVTPCRATPRAWRRLGRNDCNWRVKSQLAPMTLADRCQHLLTLQQERQKGRQAWAKLCEISAIETASKPRLDRQVDTAPPSPKSSIQRDLQDPPAETQ